MSFKTLEELSDKVFSTVPQAQVGVERTVIERIEDRFRHRGDSKVNGNV